MEGNRVGAGGGGIGIECGFGITAEHHAICIVGVAAVNGRAVVIHELSCGAEAVPPKETG